MHLCELCLCSRRALWLSQERLHSAVSATDEFQESLMRAAAYHSPRVTVVLGAESVAVEVQASTTFDSLRQTAASYWKVDAAQFVMMDDMGAQFLPGMAVLDGMRLLPCGANKTITLKPHYAVSRAAALKASAACAAVRQKVLRPKIDLTSKPEDSPVQHGKQQPGHEEDDDDDDDDDELKKTRMRLFGFGKGRMSRAQMLCGLFQTFIVFVMLMLAITTRVVVGGHAVCQSLQGEFTGGSFNYDHLSRNSTTTFHGIQSARQLQTYLNEELPKRLFGASRAAELRTVDENGERRPRMAEDKANDIHNKYDLYSSQTRNHSTPPPSTARARLTDAP
jgi:hypothetical protein